MKKIILLFASSVLFSVTNSYSQEKNDLPEIRVCEPVPTDYWLSATADELMIMIENDHPEAHTAFAKLWEKFTYGIDKSYGSNERSWRPIMDRLYTVYGETIVTNLIGAYGKMYNSDFLRLAFYLDPSVTSQLKDIAIKSNNLGKHSTGLLRFVVDYSLDQSEQDDAFMFLAENGSSADLEYLLHDLRVKQVAKSSSFNQTQYDFAMNRRLSLPLTSGSIIHLIQLFPEDAEAIWKAGSANNICLTSKDAVSVISLDVSDETEYAKLLDIQIQCVGELKRVGYLNNIDNVFNLAFMRAGSVRLQSVIMEKAEFSLRKLSAVQLASIVTKYSFDEKTSGEEYAGNHLFNVGSLISEARTILLESDSLIMSASTPALFVLGTQLLLGKEDYELADRFILAGMLKIDTEKSILSDNYTENALKVALATDIGRDTKNHFLLLPAKKRAKYITKTVFDRGKGGLYWNDKEGTTELLKKALNKA